MALFDKVDDKTWLSHDGRVEVYEDGTFGFVGQTISNYEVERHGYETLEEAQVDALKYVPTHGKLVELFEDTFDNLDDDTKVWLAREMYVEHNRAFEWADVFDLSDLLSCASREELIKIIIWGDVHNELDPVRYDSSGYLEQVSNEDLYSEAEDNRDEIVEAVMDVIDEGHSIYCTDEFDTLLESITFGSWLDSDEA